MINATDLTSIICAAVLLAGIPLGFALLFGLAMSSGSYDEKHGMK